MGEVPGLTETLVPSAPTEMPGPYLRCLEFPS